MKRTERGFRIYTEFEDSYGNKVRIQESSNAEGHYCWIFCSGRDTSPHLSTTQARRIIRALTRFIGDRS